MSSGIVTISSSLASTVRAIAKLIANTRKAFIVGIGCCGASPREETRIPRGRTLT